MTLSVISYGIGYTPESTAATTVVIQPPATYQSGDLLVMGVIAAGTAGGTAPSLPSGWTRQSSSGAVLGVFTKTASASESSVTVSLAGTASASGFIAAYPAATVSSTSFQNSGNDILSYAPTFPSGVTSKETVVLVAGAVASPIDVNSNSGFQNVQYPSNWTRDVPPFGPGLTSNSDNVYPVSIGASEVTGSASNPTLSSPQGCNIYAGFLVLTITGSSSVQAITVTAIQNALLGMAITVKAISGSQSLAAILSDGATVSYYSGGDVEPQTSITPNGTGSYVYGGLTQDYAAGSDTFTANSSTTFFQNIADSGNVATYGTLRSTSTTTQGNAVTLGGTAPTNYTNAAYAEVLKAPGQTLSEITTANVAGTVNSQFATTAVSQIAYLNPAPPVGSLLVVMVSANGHWDSGNFDGNTLFSVSDSTGLNWVPVTQSTFIGFTGVFMAQGELTYQNQPIQAPIHTTWSKGGRVISSKVGSVSNPPPPPGSPGPPVSLRLSRLPVPMVSNAGCRVIPIAPG